MKKLLTAALVISMLATLFAFNAGATDNSVWLVDKNTEITVPAEFLAGYAAISQNTMDVSAAGYQYLHFKMHFAEETNFEYPTLWAYVVLSDNAESPTATNANTYNLTATATYKAGWNDIVIPLSGFVSYEGRADNVLIGDWTNNVKWFRFVTVGAECPEIKIKDIYLSVNENDPMPGSASSEVSSSEVSGSSEGSNPVQPSSSDTSGSPNTGSFALFAVALMTVSAAGAVTVSKKRRK